MLNTTLVVLLALAGSSSVSARRQFADVRQVADADRAHVEHKVQLHKARMAKRMAQGWEPPVPKSRRSTDPPALAKRQSDSGQADIPLTLIVSAGLDSSWYGNITVGEGSEQTEFGVIFDTGSADLWVPAADSNFSPSYDCDASSSCNDLNENFSIQYGSGSTAGFLIEDTVGMAGLEVTDQTMALADTGLRQLLDSDFDGILGLAFSSIAEAQANTIVENLLDEGVIEDHLFGVQMKRSESNVKDASEADYFESSSAYFSDTANQKRQIDNPFGDGDGLDSVATITATGASAPTETETGSGSGSSDGSSGGGNPFKMPTTQVDGGVIHLGYANRDFYQGDLNWQDLTYAGYWEVVVDGLTNQGDTVSSTQHHTIFDTGTTLIFLPPDVADAFAQELGATSIPDPGYQGYYSMPCDDLDNLEVGVQYGGQTYPIAATDLDLGVYDSNRCVVGFIGSGMTDLQGNALGILGAAFLKNVYSVYDIENERVGLAQLSEAHSDDITSETNDRTSNADNDEDDDSGASGLFSKSSLASGLMVAVTSLAVSQML